MGADCGALLLAILAIRVSKRPARPDRTYGHRRYQPLAAYTNGLFLLALTVGVVVEATRRLVSPPQVNGFIMLSIAVVGAIANFSAFLVLSGKDSLNERGARAHVLSDLLGSAAAIVGAILILEFDWRLADPLLSLAVSMLIFRSGWQLARSSAHVLLEGVPAGLDVEEIRQKLKLLPGVEDIHHVHAWTLSGESPIVTLHAELANEIDHALALDALLDELHERFGIEHATIQIEQGDCAMPAAIKGCHDLK